MTLMIPPIGFRRYKEFQFTSGQLYNLRFPRSSAPHSNGISPSITSIFRDRDEYLTIVIGLGISVTDKLHQDPPIGQSCKGRISKTCPSVSIVRETLSMIHQLFGHRPRTTIVNRTLQIDILPMIGIRLRAVATVISEQKCVGRHAEQARILSLNIVGRQLNPSRIYLPDNFMACRFHCIVYCVSAIVGHGTNCFADSLFVPVDNRRNSGCIFRGRL